MHQCPEPGITCSRIVQSNQLSKKSVPHQAPLGYDEFTLTQRCNIAACPHVQAHGRGTVGVAPEAEFADVLVHI